MYNSNKQGKFNYNTDTQNGRKKDPEILKIQKKAYNMTGRNYKKGKINGIQDGREDYRNNFNELLMCKEVSKSSMDNYKFKNLKKSKII